ncbi:Ribonuclease h domain [Thalictrum thalictroides]|uniref:Ribonuclease h domain n=1 Tax=Thalictrum thalictroides TaxID=46969 RepID=A0A7J6V0J1_THATH|nr:Ribonuclease h domain [Thalictrum thalictroides]
MADSGGWAAVIQDHPGAVVAASKGASTYRTIAGIELQGLQNGLQLALRNNVRKLKAQTNSSNVVSFLKYGSTHPWELKQMVNRIKTLTAQMEQFQIKHIYREVNIAKDTLTYY